MRDSWLLLKSDSISWRKPPKNSHNSQIQWLVVNAPCQETKKLLNRKVGFEGTPRLDPHWKLQPVAYKVKKEWKSMNKDSSHSWVRILMTWTNWSQTWTIRKRRQRAETSEMQFEDCTLKLNTCDFASRSKAKAKPEGRNSVNPSTRTVHIGERTWTDIKPQKYSLSDYSVSKKLITLLRHGSLPRENDGAIEFLRIKDHLQDHFVYAHHWADEEWKSSMQEEEETRTYSSIQMILQEQFCTSELSKVIQDAILLILHYKTMSWFRTVSWSTFITLNLQSIYLPSAIQDWYREVKIWATFCLWIPWIKNTRILRRSTWEHRVLHKRCVKHERNIKTRCIGSTANLFTRKDWSSIKHDRTPSSFTTRFQLIASRKLFGWKLEKLYSKNCTYIP